MNFSRLTVKPMIKEVHSLGCAGCINTHSCTVGKGMFNRMYKESVALSES